MNRVALLTGKGTVILADFENSQSKLSDEIDTNSLPLLSPCVGDQFTSL